MSETRMTANPSDLIGLSAAVPRPERPAAMPGLRPIRVTILGLRGLPDVQGGVERHVEQLAPRLARHGCEIDVLVRKPYVARKSTSHWNGIRLIPVPCPTAAATEAIVHTTLGILHAGFIKRPDILHLHAVGPSLLTPLARTLGLKVVVTHHGYDYERQKWGTFAKAMLRLGEWCGMQLSSRRIAVSQAIAHRMRSKHGTEIVAIPNGVDIPSADADASFLEPFGLTPGRYILAVGRIVPEKRHKDLIAAFDKARPDGFKLAIVGAADHPDAYSRSVEQLGADTPGVVMTGFQTGPTLHALYAHAGMFVLPSTHEGLPISLLEALSYGLPSIASDIAANIEVGLAPEDYFEVTNIEDLAQHIAAKAGSGLTLEDKKARRDHVSNYFSWDHVTRMTIDNYRRTLALEPQGKTETHVLPENLPPIASVPPAGSTGQKTTAHLRHLPDNAAQPSTAGQTG